MHDSSSIDTPGSDVAGYRSATEHLKDECTLVRLHLEAVARRRLLGLPSHDAVDPVMANLQQRLLAQRAVVDHRLARSSTTHVPFLRLRAALGLNHREVAVLLFLVAVEVDLGLRDQALALVASRAATEPDVALLMELHYAGDTHAAPTTELGADGRLARYALMHVATQGATFVLRSLRATARVLALAHGRDSIDRDLTRILDPLPPLALSQLVLGEMPFDELDGLVNATLTMARRGAAHPVIVLPAATGAGRKAVLAASAAEHGRTVLRVRMPALPRDEATLRALAPRLLREAKLADALVVLDGVEPQAAGTAAEPLDLLLFGDEAIPLAATCAKLTGRPPAFARGTVVVDLGSAGEAAREELWHRAIGGAQDRSLARWAAERYTVTPGVIAAAAASATARAAARDAGPPALVAADLHEGLRGVLDAKLATLGSRITWRQTWDDLVLPDDALLEIREFIARVRHRRQVYEGWGFGRKVAKGMGLSALFSGPPGTGKTMVAGIIADALQLDLYQIDLSKVVSKWVGETEKNLGELFDAAEAGHAILLFDEADSLFAKRTSVQSSNDRYANLEVNYLLQRLEAFAGIVILTTNHETAIDEAFRRRLSLRVDFPVPDPDERLRLWRAVLPVEAALAADIDFAALADRFEMTGGYIKNAAVRAAFLAADERTPIAMRHLLRAARSEYQAMGKVIAHL